MILRWWMSNLLSLHGLWCQKVWIILKPNQNTPSICWSRCRGLRQWECWWPPAALRLCNGNIPILQEQGGDIQGAGLSSGRTRTVFTSSRHYQLFPFQSHHEINENMRGILVDWLVEVSRRSPNWPPVKQMCYRFRKVLSWTTRLCTLRWKWLIYTCQRSRWVLYIARGEARLYFVTNRSRKKICSWLERSPA